MFKKETGYVDNLSRAKVLATKEDNTWILFTISLYDSQEDDRVLKFFSTGDSKVNHVRLVDPEYLEYEEGKYVQGELFNRGFYLKFNFVA